MYIFAITLDEAKEIGLYTIEYTDEEFRELPFGPLIKYVDLSSVDHIEIPVNGPTYMTCITDSNDDDIVSEIPIFNPLSPFFYFWPTRADMGNIAVNYEYPDKVEISRKGEPADMAYMISFCRSIWVPGLAGGGLSFILISQSEVGKTKLKDFEEYILWYTSPPSGSHLTKAVEPTKSTGKVLQAPMLQVPKRTAYILMRRT